PKAREKWLGDDGRAALTHARAALAPRHSGGGLREAAAEFNARRAD
ncbi:MAG: hypothetical protein JJE27_05095, partial [Thermoleophilia bacterium]|nr:hypothetical protein [Thermoleophilia bacterium]